uniref:OmpH family outer membrane protein n=1 Tax=Niveibacterium sp. SC-1 TaxID=3135646 RepID=UPI0040542A7E
MTKTRLLLALAFGLLAAASAHAQSKIGFVSSERVLREAVPAVKAQKKLEKEFEKRDQDLQRMAKQLQSMQESLEKNGVTMGDADRKANEREYADLNREFQRRQREFREDLNQRRNEELAGVLERANKAIREIAETEKYDAILQDAIYINPRVDLTDRVIKALADK